MQITYYGQSCFSVVVNGKHLLFDPFISHNELAKNIDVNSTKADYILLSHGHADHMADAVNIAKRTGAKVIAAFEIHEWFHKQGVENTHPMNTGGKWDFNTFAVKCVVAHHSSSFSDGSYAGNPLGFVITSEEGDFYYSGDTALTLDMQLIPRWAKLKFALLPIGDNFTMGAEDAAECANMIKCDNVVGLHYDTFGFIKIDKEKANQIFSEAEKKLFLPAIGETIEL